MMGMYSDSRPERYGVLSELRTPSSTTFGLNARFYHPYGVAGVPILHNNGEHPWLPVGTKPSTGTALPYGVFGVPMVPNSGENPYLPFGQSRNELGGSPYGVAQSVPRYGHNYSEGGFQYLPGGPIFPAAPTLPGGALLPPAPTLPGGPYLGRAPLLPNSPIWPFYSYGRGWKIADGKGQTARLYSPSAFCHPCSFISGSQGVALRKKCKTISK